MRQGKLALISPVMTLTDGRCVASTRWIPIARAFWARVARGVSISPCTVSIRSARDRKSTRLNSSHGYISYAVFCLKKKKINTPRVAGGDIVERFLIIVHDAA